VSPLVYRCDARDVVMVTLAAPGLARAPDTADAIREHFSHLSFSSTLWTELDSIASAKAVADRAFVALGRVDRRLRRLRLHRIEAAANTADVTGPATHLKTDARFLAELRERGRSAAEDWIEHHLHGSRAECGPARLAGTLKRYTFG
jgi:NTE family protein